MKKREALELIASWGCCNYTPHGGKIGAECFRISHRTANAHYLADRACAPCIAHRSLYGVPVCIECTKAECQS